MRLLRPLIAIALAWLTYLIFSEARAESKKEPADMSKVVLYFGGVVLIGGVAGDRKSVV